VNDKFEFYDVLGIIVPGVMVMSLYVLCFPEAAQSLVVSVFPGSFSIIALTAMALLLGNVLQALVSLLEPVLEYSWGGRLSEKALTHGLGDRYFPHESGKRISRKLSSTVGNTSSERSRFLYAMQLAETSGNSRVGRFNALYAYSRALLLLAVFFLLLILASVFWGALAAWHLKYQITIIIVAVFLIALFWNRTKQRGMYYVREVLYTAERLLDKSTP
jgi:hypothetical protein